MINGMIRWRMGLYQPKHTPQEFQAMVHKTHVRIRISGQLKSLLLQFGPGRSMEANHLRRYTQ
jgi:hypothetical protein